MAAVNQVRWVGNVFGAKEPFRFPGKFQAGATQAIKRGEFLELSSGNFVPLSTDKAMTATVAISECEIISGDLAGYRMIIVPRPGDIFEADLSAAAGPAPGDNLFVNDSQTVKTSGTNQFGDVCDDTGPPIQDFASVNPSYDAGTTIPTRLAVRFTIKAAASYYAALQT